MGFGIDQLWVADITCIPLETEFVYVAVVIDAFSRRVFGWALDRSVGDELTLVALRMALELRRLSPGWVHHSDRGSRCAHCLTNCSNASARGAKPTREWTSFTQGAYPPGVRRAFAPLRLVAQAIEVCRLRKLFCESLDGFVTAPPAGRSCIRGGAGDRFPSPASAGHSHLRSLPDWTRPYLNPQSFTTCGRAKQSAQPRQ